MTDKIIPKTTKSKLSQLKEFMHTHQKNPEDEALRIFVLITSMIVSSALLATIFLLSKWAFFSLIHLISNVSIPQLIVNNSSALLSTTMYILVGLVIYHLGVEHTEDKILAKSLSSKEIDVIQSNNIKIGQELNKQKAYNTEINSKISTVNKEEKNTADGMQKLFENS